MGYRKIESANIEEHLKTIHELKAELGNKPQEMRDRIVALINEKKIEVKKYIEL